MGRTAWDGEAAIRRAMRPDEVLLWLGRPARPDHGGPIGVVEALLFTIVCAVAWFVAARLAEDQPLGLADLGKVVAILLLGTCFAAPLLTSRPRRLWRRRIVYAVTDRRALVVEATRRGEKATAYGPAQIAFVAERDRDDGLRDVYFREGPILPRTRPFNAIGFLGIKDTTGAMAALTALRSTNRHVIPVVGVPPA